jgi:ADP-ribosylglycohydrolase
LFQRLAADRFAFDGQHAPLVVGQQDSFLAQLCLENAVLGDEILDRALIILFGGADDSFEEAVLKAVNLGDDADTTGAICGQLAGAYWGESNIPESLRSGLARRDLLENALAGILVDLNTPL